jgi:hypothetical protein
MSPLGADAPFAALRGFHLVTEALTPSWPNRGQGGVGEDVAILPPGHQRGAGNPHATFCGNRGA